MGLSAMEREGETYHPDEGGELGSKLRLHGERYAVLLLLKVHRRPLNWEKLI